MEHKKTMKGSYVLIWWNFENFIGCCPLEIEYDKQNSPIYILKNISCKIKIKIKNKEEIFSVISTILLFLFQKKHNLKKGMTLIKL